MSGSLFTLANKANLEELISTMRKCMQNVQIDLTFLVLHANVPALYLIVSNLV